MLAEINNPVWLVLAAAVLANLLLTIFLLWQKFKDKRVVEAEDDDDAAAAIGKIKKTLTSHNKNLVEIGQLLEELVENNKLNIQKIGVVRFNPFAETGGNMSFALALLDGHGNGIVISSLHSREATRIYAKNVEGGVSKSPLTEEEKQAIAEAMDYKNKK